MEARRADGSLQVRRRWGGVARGWNGYLPLASLVSPARCAPHAPLPVRAAPACRSISTCMPRPRTIDIGHKAGLMPYIIDELKSLLNDMPIWFTVADER
jgi:hypothetical protein